MLQLYRGYQMSVSLNKLNKSILCKPLASMILFYSTSSINLVLNMYKFSILFITYFPKRTLNCKKIIIFYRHTYHITLTFSAHFHTIGIVQMSHAKVLLH